MLTTYKRHIAFAVWLIVLLQFGLGIHAQTENIFLKDWNIKEPGIWSFDTAKNSPLAPELILPLHFNDSQSIKISPYSLGYNQPVHQKGNFNENSRAIRHTRNVKPGVLRYPGGTAAMTFFWDRNENEGPPPDVDTYLKVGEVHNSYRFGMSGGDFFSVQDYYDFLDSVSVTSIIVVNYGYARYGRTEHPVQQAAHYAANWVRYDNGRTKFWEIGNELSGRWTPGHAIDTLKNNDGQPEIISGALYAKHFRIFCDSMRAAAAETGHEIYIGGVLSHTEDSWNRNFLENASHLADFLIVHEYYGEEGLTDPRIAVESADGLSDHAAIALQDISLYADTIVPLVLTEWNTKDAMQNDKCIYGISNIRGVKNIIESDINLACRHTLIHNNERGLINNQSYDTDLGIWLPRSGFFYFYYLNEVLGDTYYLQEHSSVESVDMLVSTFKNQDAGIILLNTSEDVKKVALDLHHYTSEGIYDRFQLKPFDDNPFSKKVLVNGITNEFYTDGGPFDYEEIPARRYFTNGVVQINLSPFSANFIRIKGRKDSSDQSVTIYFKIYLQSDDSISLAENVLTSLNSRCVFTSQTGEAKMKIPKGTANFQLQLNGYQSKSRKIEISTDTTIVDTLYPGMYDLFLEIRDEASGEPVKNLEVSVENNDGVTDMYGHLTFEQLHGGEKQLIIDTPYYKYNGILSVYTDTSFTIYLNRLTYQVKFRVTDKYSSNPVSGCLIETESTKTSTDLDGTSVLYLESGNHLTRFTKNNYASVEKALELSSDTIIEVAMTPLSAEVKFRVLENNTPLNEIKIILNNDSCITNTIGACSFSGLKTDSLYIYSLSHNNYLNITDSLYLLSDTTVNIILQASAIETDYEEPSLRIYPVPAGNVLKIVSSITIENISLMDISGKKIFETRTIHAKESEIYIRSAVPGIYILVIKNSRGLLRKKILIK